MEPAKIPPGRRRGTGEEPGPGPGKASGEIWIGEGPLDRSSWPSVTLVRSPNVHDGNRGGVMTYERPTIENRSDLSAQLRQLAKTSDTNVAFSPKWRRSQETK